MMKFALLFLLSFTGLAGAGSFTLAWDPAPGAALYEIRFLSVTNVSPTIIRTAALQYQFTNVTDGSTCTVNVAGISIDGLVGPQSTNKVVPLPGQVINLRVSMLFESAPEPPGPWTTESNLVMFVSSSSPNRFYRGRMEIVSGH